MIIEPDSGVITPAKHPQVDLVPVRTQAPRHEAAVRAAIAAGNNVYFEWPLTTSTSTSIPPEPPEPAGVPYIGEPCWVRAAWPTSPTQYQRKTSPTFVFRGRRVHMIKPLWWTGDGLCPVTETPF